MVLADHQKLDGWAKLHRHGGVVLLSASILEFIV
jgi:hypothetical protein